MPRIVPFHNVGSAGLIIDLPPHELPPEAWSAGQNIRFENNAVVKFKGHANIFGTPTVAPYWLLEVQNAGTNYWLYAGLTDIYATDGTTHKDISKAGTYSATEAGGWNGGVLGGIPILNNGFDDPQMWNPIDFATPGLCSDLSNWPANTTAKVLRPFKSFLVALDVTKTSTRHPHLVKWSSPADLGAVPASWDETDATELAGEKDLAETNGYLIDCQPLRDVNVLYKEDSIWGMQEINGVLVFRFFKSFETIGALSRRCIQSFRGRQICMGFDDIVLHDLQTIDSLVRDRLRKWFFNQLDATNYGLSFVARNEAKQELWFCIPTTGATRPNLALVWNMRDNTMGVRDLPEISHIAWGVVDAQETDTWDSDSQVWDADDEPWTTRQFNPAQRGFLGASPGTTELFRFDDTETFDGTAFTSYVERIGLAIVGKDRGGRPKADFESVKLVTAVQPRMEASAAVNVYVGGQDNREEGVAWQGPFSFNPNTDLKVDCAVPGRLIGVRFESTTDMNWKLHGYDLEMELMGRF